MPVQIVERRISMESSSSSNAVSSSNQLLLPPPDPLRDGPCAEQHAQLQACQQQKNIYKPSNALTYCVSETDLLISCVRKNPAYFHTMKMKK